MSAATFARSRWATTHVSAFRISCGMENVTGPAVGNTPARPNVSDTSFGPTTLPVLGDTGVGLVSTRPMMPVSVSSPPRRVYRKNFRAASRFPPPTPQPPIRKKVGTRVSSKNR